MLEQFEDRVVFDVGPNPNPTPVTPPPGAPPLAVDDTAYYQILLPSTPFTVLENDLDGNPGATWDLASLTAVTQPQFGALTLDSSSGQFLYTPNYLLPPGLPPATPPPPAQQDSFTYNVKNSLDMLSNTATVTLLPIGAPRVGDIVPEHDIGFTRGYQPVTLDIIANDVIYDGSSFAYSTVRLNDENDGYYFPKHGTVTFDPTNGKMTYTPNFGYIGWDEFGYLVSTTSGATGSGLIYIIINAEPPRLQADPNGGGQMFMVEGTNHDDTIEIVPGDRYWEVKAIVNGVTSPSFRPTSRIAVFGYGGRDTITVSPSVRWNAWLVGGLGNDVLKAGGGPTILLGNQGNDTLKGGYSRDLLIGGDGEDQLFGSYANDILVGGSTRFDSQPMAMGNLFSQWLRGRHHSRPWWCPNYPASRDVLKFSDVIDDAKQDTLNGGPGRDLILAATTGVPDVVDYGPPHHRRRGR